MLSHYIPLLLILAASSSFAILRLSNSVVPTSYDLKIKVDMATSTYSGTVYIRVNCKEATNSITLHAKEQYDGLDVAENDIEVVKTGEGSAIIGKNGVSLDHVNELLSITLNSDLEVGKYYILNIPFKGKIYPVNQGFFYWKKTEEVTFITKSFLMTDFRRTLARTVFPCFDEPSMKARFVLTLGMKDNEYSISNMKLLSREQIKERPGWSWDTYRETPPLSPSQLSFIVTDMRLHSVETMAPAQVDISIKSWARKELEDIMLPTDILIGNYLYLLVRSSGLPKITPKSLQKIDYLVIPSDDDIEISNFGLIAESESDYIERNREGDTLYEMHVMYEQAARQWFGAIVSPKWWDSDWLLRALARYIPLYLIPDAYFNSDVFPTLLSIMDSNSKETTEIISQLGDDVNSEDIEGKLDKGMMLLRMVHLTIGDRNFLQGVQDFVKKYMYGSISTEDFWNVLDTKTTVKRGIRRRLVMLLPPGVPMRDIMSSWTDQEGFPIIRVERNFKEGTAKVTQERYVGSYYDRKVKAESSQQSDTASSGCWWIPLTFSTGARHFKETQAVTWLSCRDQQTGIVVKTGGNRYNWIIFNNQFSGLYRVNYDDSNWSHIIRALHKVTELHKIHVLNRAQLVSDVLSFSWSGELGFEPAFRLISYLHYEQRAEVWRSFFIGALSFKNGLARTSLYDQFQEFTKVILTQKYNTVYHSKDVIEKHINHDKGTTDANVKSSIQEWSCDCGVSQCISHSKEVFASWKSKGIPKVNNEYPRYLVYIVLCTVLNDPDSDSAYQYVFNDLITTQTDDVTRPLLLSALWCTYNRPALNRLLQWATTKTSDNFQLVEKQFVFDSLLQGRVSFEPALQYFYNNFRKIYRFYGNFETIAGFIETMVSVMNLEELQQLQAFVRSTRDINKREINVAINRGQEEARKKAVWMADRSNSFKETLEKLKGLKVF